MKWFFLFLASTLSSQTVVLSTWNHGGIKGLGIQTSAKESEFFLWSDLKKSAAGGVRADSVLLGVVDWPSLSLARMKLNLPRAWDGAWNQSSAQTRLKKSAKEAHDWGVVTRVEEWVGWGLLSERRRSVGLSGEWQDVLIFQRMGWELALHHLSPTPSNSWFVRSEVEHLVAQAQLKLGGGSGSNAWDVLLVVDKEESRTPAPLMMMRLAVSPQPWIEYWVAGCYQKSLQAHNRLQIKGGGLSLIQDLEVDWEQGKGSKELKTQAAWSPWGTKEGIKLHGELLAQMGWEAWDYSSAKWNLGLDFKLANIVLGVVVKDCLNEVWKDPRLKASLELGIQDLEVSALVQHHQNDFSGSLKIKLDHPQILGLIQIPWEANKGVRNWELSLGYRF